jgi:hypothetical protein
MFAALYVNGHLVTIAFSLTMALAFAVSAARIPGQVGDLWMVLGFLVTTSLGAVEMLMCFKSSLALARTHLVLGGVLLFIVAMGIYLRYGSDLRDPVFRRRIGGFIWAYGVLTAVLLFLVAIGALERDTHLRTIELWGVRVAMPHFRMDGFAIQFAYTCLQAPILLPVLLADGERRAERRMLALPIALVPLVGLYEDLVCLGVNPYLPLSGYYATAAGLTGAFVLVERFRALTRGDMVGRYLVGKRLGGGGMADVYEARAAGEEELLQVERRVALKRMRPELSGNPEFVQMFLDEARITSRLSHPHIVAVHDIGQAKGELYIAMELVEGASLARVLGRLRALGEVVDPDVAIALGAELADALAYAHGLADEDGRALEIIHRDVSPQNILLTRSGHLKLADFGIARSADRQSLTVAGRLKGKAAYMAPEQIRGDPYDHRVDLYAAGVVRFELVTGVKPFDGDSDGAVLSRILAGTVNGDTRLRTLPAPLRELILRMLASQPDDRPARADDVFCALSAMHAGAARDKVVRLVAETEAAIERERAGEEPTAADRPRAGAA